MLRTTLASSRALRVCALGLITFTTAILISSESAEARRYKHRRHHVVRESYSPQFSSIIVEEGKRLLKASGMNFATADSMGEAAASVVQLAGQSVVS